MLVLEYHSIQISSLCPYMLSILEFEKHIEFFLKKEYSFINLNEKQDFSKDLKKKVLITFDDGYEDNYNVVFPIIKKYNIPISIFLATEYIGKSMRLGKITLPMLKEEQIKEMYDSGLVYFGSHTHSHSILNGELSTEFVENDLKKSKDIIYRLLGYETKFFVYPKGRYNSKYIKLIKQEFDFAFTTKLGCIKNISTPYFLPRVEILANENKLKRYLKMNCFINVFKVFSKMKFFLER